MAFDVDDFGVVGGCVESLLSLGCMVAILLDACRLIDGICTPSKFRRVR